MSVTEVSFATATASDVSGKTLPAIGQSPAHYAGCAFETGASAPDRPGVFVLATQLSGRAHPVYVGESDSIIVAVSAILAANPVLKRIIAGVFWKVSPVAHDRKHVIESLVKEYQPHLNVAIDVEKQAPNRAPEHVDRVDDPIELIARFGVA